MHAGVMVFYAGVSSHRGPVCGFGLGLKRLAVFQESCVQQQWWTLERGALGLIVGRVLGSSWYTTNTLKIGGKNTNFPQPCDHPLQI